jgi:predicted transcriptional regulator of viral defense system
MTFKEFHNTLQSFIVFSNKNIEGIYRSIDRRRLYEWNKKGYITMLRNGYYVFNEFTDSPYISLLTSNLIYEPSYISNEFALSYYGIIPEAVFSVTAVTTKKTATIETPLGSFYYRNIKAPLFKGYTFIQVPFYMDGKILERSVMMAMPEKALFDFFYYKTNILTIAEIEAYRFDADSIKSLNRKELDNYLSFTKNKSCIENINLILSYYDNI